MNLISLTPIDSGVFNAYAWMTLKSSLIKTHDINDLVVLIILSTLINLKVPVAFASTYI
jgi:hypothetical protein